ncbi:uncharacterized CRM domain-containing protein At3g25440, chloroplastic-like isoform X1 [Zingiber officinale]|uniref:uncharacterized CRM domain-containing protein At3g25440, chloroplastic-like isoform X1 n=2 Tax=Zingiber officinale TaxID=94328 RepID=UPI001C4D72A2|nr:uncharacterized CRM domain-containing protein At3g25440, chloroplastic-like isoform X1 [Zingiber officinale]XP_042375652.1 uncharacterized CRM domain-containing protein At3g25440, chloroplastic-like isoform X1 [Zingiber officinale]
MVSRTLTCHLSRLLLRCPPPQIPNDSTPLLFRCRRLLEKFDPRGTIQGGACSLPPLLTPSVSLESCSNKYSKVHCQSTRYGVSSYLIGINVNGLRNVHSYQPLKNTGQDVVESLNATETEVPVNDQCGAKLKRKKLKGRRAVVKWLKYFRFKKKKEYERMTAEEKILFKLKKAKRKEERLVEAMKKIEPTASSETTHDPEILTPEEHFYFLKMGLKCKNYVPVGRRGVFQGVILNMHLHWKKHQTLQVVVKTFSPEEVREIAEELARLSGGIVLDIHEENTIIMYRGKNYVQPPTEIMSPKVTLSRKKALDKSKYRDGLHAVRRFIPKLHQDLEDLHERMKREGESINIAIEGATSDVVENKIAPCSNMKSLKELEVEEARHEPIDDDALVESSSWSESEDLSDIFETDSEAETEQSERPLYLDALEKFPSNMGKEPEDFEEHLRQIAAASKRANLSTKEVKLGDLDEVDKIFLRASALLKKRR